MSEKNDCIEIEMYPTEGTELSENNLAIEPIKENTNTDSESS